MTNNKSKTTFPLALTLMTVISTLCSVPSHAFADNAVIEAQYGIEYAGMEVGKFNFSSKLDGKSYALEGNTKISVLGSLFRWKAEAKSSGTINGGKITPASFSYELKGDKPKAVEVTFPNTQSDKIKVTPELTPSDGRVEIKPEHLRNIIDPMSGLIALTQKPTSGPDKSICDQKVPVFDGKERYDIQLQFKMMKVVELSDNTRKTAVVCQLKYEPVSGHKKDGKTQKFLKNSKEILIWLVPFPKGNMYVPHRIDIPTPLGSATVVSRKFNLKRTGEAKVVSFQ